MVIATSDSCNTLVGLGNDTKPAESGFSNRQVQPAAYLETELQLPQDDFGYDDDSFCSSNQKQRIFLPRDGSSDLYLRTVPQVMESCDTLLANKPVRFTKDSREDILYVYQGEVAHATSGQCDFLVSDKATTCHILALRSTSGIGEAPLASLAHIDSSSYSSCIRSMVNEHKTFHKQASNIDIDIHVMGGFEDEGARAITDWLLHLLAAIAAEEKEYLTMRLQTCAVSSMNDTGHSCPIGRGLGLSIETGEVFLAQVDQPVAGPGLPLRSARLWSDNEQRKLAVIHTQFSNQITISPFQYSSVKDANLLLSLPDNIMLQYTSTSPHVEEDDFCQGIRETLKFMDEVACSSVFGALCNRSVSFRRVLTGNKWQRVCC